MPGSDPALPDASLDSVQLRDLIDRTRAGDRAAEDQLIRAILGRFRALACRMLKRFPAVEQWEQTGDVVQDALVRLLRALRTVTPPTTRDFFNLAAEQIRRQLIDLARRHRRDLRSPEVDDHPDGNENENEPFDPAPSATDLERWEQFHRAVANLPPEEREVFMLTYYHGWTQPRIAELFRVDERTVGRRWRAAVRVLDREVGGQLPGL